MKQDCRSDTAIRMTDQHLYMDPDKLVEEYLPLVRSVAAKYSSTHNSLDDLVQEGMIGLLEANQRFDPSRGTQFGTYAHYWISKRILYVLERETDVPADPNTMAEIADPAGAGAQLISSNLLSKLPREMPLPERQVILFSYEKGYTIARIAEELGVSRERVKQLRAKALRRLRVGLKDGAGN